MSRRLALLLLLLLLAASPAHGAIAIVQTVSCATHGTTSCTTGAVTTTTGNLFIAASSWQFAGQTFTSITDSKGNSYTNAVPNTVDTAGGNYNSRHDYVAAGTGGASHTFTATVSSGGFVSTSVSEVSGAAASPLDKTAVGADGNGTSHSTASTTTTAQANELLIGSGTAGDTVTFTCGGSFTEQANFAADSGTNVSGLLACSRIVAAAATYAFPFTTSGLARTSSGISTWKEAVAATTRQRCVGCGADGKVIE